MQPLNELDTAEIRLEFRRLYAEIGVEGMAQVLYELLISAQICSEIINEEYNEESKVE